MSENKVLERAQIEDQYKWDLSSLFNSDEDWNEAFQAVDELIEKLPAYAGKLSESPETLRAFLDEQETVSRKMSNAELMQALRFDISGELEAIFLYDAHYHATDDPVAKAVLADIRDEEKVHVGELITLMRYLDPREAECFLEGEAEVHEMLEKLGMHGKADGIAPAEGPTVGSLVK